MLKKKLYKIIFGILKLLDLSIFLKKSKIWKSNFWLIIIVKITNDIVSNIKDSQEFYLKLKSYLNQRNFIIFNYNIYIYIQI